MVLLDTHVFVWLASAQEQLSERATRAIHDHAGALSLSAISALEIGILVKRRRLSLPLEPLEFIVRALEHHGVEEVPVDAHIALASTALPDIHNDPFDRIIIATAQMSGMTILSKDRVIATYPDTTVIWG